MYQVTGACANFTAGTAYGPMKTMYLKGAIVPEGVPQHEIDHHLSVGLITDIGSDPFKAPVDGNGGVAVVDQAAADEAGRVAQNAAKAKLPSDGSAPAGNLGRDVWAEFLVAKGYDRGEVEKLGTRDDMKKFWDSTSPSAQTPAK